MCNALNELCKWMVEQRLRMIVKRQTLSRAAMDRKSWRANVLKRYSIEKKRNLEICLKN